MTIRTIARDAVRAFPKRDYTDKRAVRHLRRGYIRCRIILGTRWVGYSPKKIHEQRDTLALAVTVAGALPILIHDVALGIAMRVLA